MCGKNTLSTWNLGPVYIFNFYIKIIAVYIFGKFTHWNEVRNFLKLETLTTTVSWNFVLNVSVQIIIN